MELDKYLTYKNEGSVKLTKNEDGTYDVTYLKDGTAKAKIDVVKLEDLRTQKAGLVSLLDNVNTLIKDLEELG